MVRLLRDSAGSILTGGLNRDAGENVGVYGINQGGLVLTSGNYDLAVLQPGNLVGQCRIGIAIDLGLGVGDHIQQCLGDGQVVALAMPIRA